MRSPAPIPNFARFFAGLRILLLGMLLAGPGTLAHAEPFVITERFIAFLIEGRNAHTAVSARKVSVMNLGLRADGKFYPYSTPRGRRIGYELPLASVFDHTRGITRDEADARLRAAVQATAAELSEAIPQLFPGRTFEQLDLAGQEMLVDHALSEGVANLPRAFVDAVYSPNRIATLSADCLHLRYWGGMMQILKNRAFGYRWLGN